MKFIWQKRSFWEDFWSVDGALSRNLNLKSFFVSSKINSFIKSSALVSSREKSWALNPSLTTINVNVKPEGEKQQKQQQKLFADYSTNFNLFSILLHLRTSTTWKWIYWLIDGVYFREILLKKLLNFTFNSNLLTLMCVHYNFQ